MNTRKLTALLLTLTLATTIYSCKTASTASEPSAAATVSYASDLKPLMERSCAPCHFPEGKKLKLDTYEATKSNIKSIIARMELPAEDPKYMPYKSKKPAMSPEEIQKFKDWASQRMKP